MHLITFRYLLALLLVFLGVDLLNVARGDDFLDQKIVELLDPLTGPKISAEKRDQCNPISYELREISNSPGENVYCG